jgi:hypothetical protein
MATPGLAFRQLLRTEPYVFTGGIYSPLDAQLAQRVGMKAIYMSGYSVAMLNGWPDMGFLTMTEMTRTAAMVASAVSIPIIADADDGYGSALNTMRTVAEFVRSGVAGIHLEDQQYPKRCGHIAGKTIVTRAEAVGKFRAAVAERDRLDREFVLIARTDALGAVGGSLEEAIARSGLCGCRRGSRLVRVLQRHARADRGLRRGHAQDAPGAAARVQLLVLLPVAPGSRSADLPGAGDARLPLHLHHHLRGARGQPTPSGTRWRIWSAARSKPSGRSRR